MSEEKWWKASSKTRLVVPSRTHEEDISDCEEEHLLMLLTIRNHYEDMEQDVRWLERRIMDETS